MRKDHRPYFIKSLENKVVTWYADKYLRPQFLSLGKSLMTVRPWHITVFGYNVKLGDYATILAEPDNKVNLVSWAQSDFKELSEIITSSAKKMDDPEDEKQWEGTGSIEIGDYALICPGVRIQAATRIAIGHGVMIAQRVYITDSDWHGIYNRCMPVGTTRPVTIGNNVWIGDGAMVCKGVTIGDNSIIGAGAVVSRDVPQNCIAAGNPATVVKHLDPDIPITGREVMFKNYRSTWDTLDAVDRDVHKANTFGGWLRHIVAPRWGD